jgi:hypothetical protein
MLIVVHPVPAASWPHLGSSRGSRSSIPAQEDGKNVASGADHAAE